MVRYCVIFRYFPCSLGLKQSQQRLWRTESFKFTNKWNKQTIREEISTQLSVVLYIQTEIPVSASRWWQNVQQRGRSHVCLKTLLINTCEQLVQINATQVQLWQKHPRNDNNVKCIHPTLCSECPFGLLWNEVKTLSGHVNKVSSKQLLRQSIVFHWSRLWYILHMSTHSRTPKSIWINMKK